jgi:hypothetical protein
VYLITGLNNIHTHMTTHSHTSENLLLIVADMFLRIPITLRAVIYRESMYRVKHRVRLNNNNNNNNQYTQTFREVTANRPDIIMKNNKEKTCTLIDVAIPTDRNVV